MEDEYVNHTVVLPGQCPAIIARTKGIAEDVAKRLYGESWKSKGVVVRKTTTKDIQLFSPRGTK
ncbi:hypothetical protein KASHIRA_02690 [Serratia phage vB_SmaM-Kashira]|nr:hypothetical protein KASHIRA_02690 [Serratia phage vB_SmaM-Kashira]